MLQVSPKGAKAAAAARARGASKTAAPAPNAAAPTATAPAAAVPGAVPAQYQQLLQNVLASGGLKVPKGGAAPYLTPAQANAFDNLMYKYTGDLSAIPTAEAEALAKYNPETLHNGYVSTVKDEMTYGNKGVTGAESFGARGLSHSSIADNAMADLAATQVMADNVAKATYNTAMQKYASDVVTYNGDIGAATAEYAGNMVANAMAVPPTTGVPHQNPHPGLPPTSKANLSTTNNPRGAPIPRTLGAATPTSGSLSPTITPTAPTSLSTATAPGMTLTRQGMAPGTAARAAGVRAGGR